MKQERWNSEVVEMKQVIVTDEEYEQRLAEIVKILYDEFSQRPKLSQNLDLGMIQQVQEFELERTGTDG